MSKKNKALKRNKRLVSYFNEQAGVCAYCHEEMTLELGRQNTATIEHIHPKSKGGEKERFNEVAACSDCNTRKSDLPIAYWLRKSAKEFAKSKVIQFPLPGFEEGVA